MLLSDDNLTISEHRKSTFSIRFSEDRTLAMSYNLRTLAALPTKYQDYMKFISPDSATAVRLEKHNESTDFSYWSPRGLLQGAALRLHQVRSYQPAASIDFISMD